MAMHELYWELQALLKKYGLVRSKRTAGVKEIEVWIQPYEELKLTLVAGRASKVDIRSALAKAMKARAPTVRREKPKECGLCGMSYIGTPGMHKFDCPAQSADAQAGSFS